MAANRRPKRTSRPERTPNESLAAAGAPREGLSGGPGSTPKGLTQPSPIPGPLHARSPTDPALRANPYPEVTDLICRLPLPTLLLSTRGCSPWRPAADMGTDWRENHTTSPGFSRADGSAADTAGGAVLYGSYVPISGSTHSREFAPYKEKRTLPATAADVSWLVCVAALGAGAPISPSRYGNINPFPFR